MQFRRINQKHQSQRSVRLPTATVKPPCFVTPEKGPPLTPRNGSAHGSGSEIELLTPRNQRGMRRSETRLRSGARAGPLQLHISPFRDRSRFLSTAMHGLRRTLASLVLRGSAFPGFATILDFLESAEHAPRRTLASSLVQSPLPPLLLDRRTLESCLV